MDDSLNSGKVFLAGLLVKLHHDKMTGVVTVKDNQRALKIFLKEGYVVYADGIDKDIQLLKEIATKKKLENQEQEELKSLKEKDPQSLGRILIERKLISSAVWTKFLELKVKHILSVAFQMDTDDVGFSKSELDILPVNFIDYNTVQLLLETERAIKKPGYFEKQIQGDDAVFTLSREVARLKAGIPLSPSEQTILSLIDGKRPVGEIPVETGIDPANIYKALHLLLSFGLIDPVSGDHEEEEDIHYAEIVNLYLDLIQIIETHFRKEVGREYEKIFKERKDELPGESKELFRDLDLSQESRAGIAEEISRRFASQGKMNEGKLFLLSSFNKLIYLLIMNMKKILGLGLTEKTLHEMWNILEYVEKYRQDTELMDYVRGNLKDYLQQIQSG